MNTPSSGGVTTWLEDNPTIALGGVLVVVLLGGGLLMRKKAGVPGAALGSSANPTGASQDLSGLKDGIVYIPTQTSFSTYNATDASQHVSDTGSGNVTTGSSSAGNTINPGQTIVHAPIGHPRKPPVVGPAKVKMVWTQHMITSNQS